MVYKPALTGMRGVASIYVLLYHSTGSAIPTVSAFLFGWSGVNFFFILSGYLLASLYSSVNVRYYIRRIFRTFPLYYATIPLFIFVGYIYFNPLWLIYAQNYFFPMNKGPQWTLTQEELFYFLLLPPLLWLRNRLGDSWRTWFTVITIFAGVMSIIYSLYITAITSGMPANSATGIYSNWLSQQMPFYFVDYMIGVTISGISISSHLQSRFAILSAILFAIGIVVIQHGQNFYLSPIFCGAIYGMMILGLQNSRIFSNKVMELLGKWSYGIYLLQIPLLLLFGPWGIPLTIIGAAATYYLLEMPFQKLGNRVLDWIDNSNFKGLDVL